MLALIVAIAVAACGSALTRHDYVLRAEGICNSTLRSLRLLEQPTLSGSAGARTASLSRYLDRAVPLIQAQLSKLKQLPVPLQTQGQSRALRRYLGALQITVEELRDLAAAARGGNAQLVDADQKTLAAGSTSALAASYGLHACSNPGAGYS